MTFAATLLRRRRTPQGQKGIYRFAQGYRKVNRTAILNHLVRRHGYEDYLEIGVRQADNFSRIRVPRKSGVDPAPEAPSTHRMTSDAFFAQLPGDARFDLIFIDGLHEEVQVLRDVHNALRVLRPAGTVALHDCNPPTLWHQRDACEDGGEAWNGTVWRAWARLRCERRDLRMHVVDTDWGVGLIQNGTQEPYALPATARLDFDFLQAHRRELLQLIRVERFLELY